MPVMTATAGSELLAASLNHVSFGPPLVIALAAAALVSLIWRYRAQAVLSPGANVGRYAVPQPPGGLPLLGHLFPVLANQPRFQDWVLGLARSMNWRTFAFSLPFVPTWYVVTDPVCLEWVLKTDMPNYVKGAVNRRNFKPLLGGGIFTSDGEEWLWQRKLATNIFSVRSFKRYISAAFNAKLDALTRRLANAAANNQVVDLQDLMYRFTLDSFGLIGFGVDLGCLSTEGPVPFAAAFDRAQVITTERFVTPGWQLLELLNGRRSELARCCSVVRGFARSIIRERRAQLTAVAAKLGGAVASPTAVLGALASDVGNADARSDTGSAAGGPASPLSSSGSAHSNILADSLASGGSAHGSNSGSCGNSPRALPPGVHDTDGESRDLLSLFLDAAGPDGQPLSDQVLEDAVINFIIAGRDTTAQALTWTVYELLRHPKELEAVRAELAGLALHDVRPDYDTLRGLRVTRAAFHEALRLHPSVPNDVKHAVKTGKLPDGSIIPAGGRVLYSPYVINRLPAFWGPDAEDFRPRRWLEAAKLPSPYSYISFNAGPRICLGQRLAELEGVYVLAGLLSTFDLQLARDTTVPASYTFSASLPMAGGLPVYVRARQRA